MHLFHIPQHTIHNRNVHISVPNGALWDMERLHCMWDLWIGPIRSVDRTQVNGTILMMISYLQSSRFRTRIICRRNSYLFNGTSYIWNNSKQYSHRWTPNVRFKQLHGMSQLKQMPLNARFTNIHTLWSFALQWSHNERNLCYKSSAWLLFTQLFVQAQSKKTSKLRVTGLSDGDRWILRTKGQ